MELGLAHRCALLPIAAVADPVVVELREWSRIAEDLGAERNRLTNRFREQLWRYFPGAILELEADLGAEWLLDLWETVPTPDKAARIRDTTIARLLKRHRVRRFDAAQVLSILRAPPVRVGAGTAEAASAQIATLITRIRLVNRQLKQAHHKLDATVTASSRPRRPSRGRGSSMTWRSSHPCREWEGSSLATPPAEAFDALQRRDYAALRSLRGRARHQALRQELHSRQTIRLPRPARQRHVSLGARRRSARPKKPLEIRRSANPGHSHARALRSVAIRLLNVACAMLKSGTTFDHSITAKQTA